jgi:hypothetical protein
MKGFITEVPDTIFSSKGCQHKAEKTHKALDVDECAAMLEFIREPGE